MHAQVVVSSHHGTLLSNKKEQTAGRYANMDELESLMLSERNRTQKITEFNSMYVLSKRQNYSVRKRSSGFQQSERGWEETDDK